MKKLISTLAFLMIVAVSFAQQLTVNGGAEALKKSKASTGVFEFTSTGIELSAIEQHAKTYASWFTVTASEGKAGIAISIKMHKNESQTRRVMHRYFVTINVGSVVVDGNEMKVDEFIEKFII
jgi:hypothetical protein